MTFRPLTALSLLFYSNERKVRFYMGLNTARALMCLLLIQVSFNFPAVADGTNFNILNPSMMTQSSPAEYEYLSDLALRVMLDKPLYDFVNKKFETELNKNPKLSQTKIIYLLENVKKYWPEIETYLENRQNQAAALAPQNKDAINVADIKGILDTSEILPPVRMSRAQKISIPEHIQAARAAKSDGMQENDQRVFEKIADEIKGNVELAKNLSNNISIAQPLLIRSESGQNTIDQIDFSANHDRYEDPYSDRTDKIVGADHRKFFVDLIKSLEKGDRLYMNFYDFDMPELVDSIIEAYKKGVDILLGVDLGIYKEKEAARIQIDRLYAVINEPKKAGYGSLQVELVDSVGLNHQKLIAGIRHERNIARDKKLPVAKRKNLKSFAMASSGNATQSCNGPEGDLKNWREAIRPNASIPNPNHLTLFQGEYAPRIVASEIRKNLIYKLRGQAAFPIGGAYLLEGKAMPNPLDTEKVLFAYSPNGGAGDINRDIYSQMFDMAHGDMWFSFFSFSSEQLGDKMVEYMIREIRSRRESGRSLNDMVRGIIDGGFAMRDYSVLLKILGYNLVEFDANDPFKIPGVKKPVVDPERFEKPEEAEERKVKYYVENMDEKWVKMLRAEFKSKKEFDVWFSNLRSNFRITPPWFKETQFTNKDTGEKAKNQVKAHHKAFAFPEANLSNPGSSINLSVAGESNQEQIVIVKSKRITDKLVGTIKYLYESDQFSNEALSIHKVALERNKRLTPADLAKAKEVYEFRKKWATPGEFMCLKFYVGAK